MFDTPICVVGLGYVGLPLINKIVEAGFTDVVGVDVAPDRLSNIRQGIDHTQRIPSQTMLRTAKVAKWSRTVPVAKVYIICVPTPDVGGVPCYSYVTSACTSIADVCEGDATVVLESTVAPGTTSGLVASIFKKAKKDSVSLIYSPERINPGKGAYDTLSSDVKLMAVDDDNPAAKRVEGLYRAIFRHVEVIHDTRAAELAKCFENFQRDMNIAMMNELSMHCRTHGIDMRAVQFALQTKQSGLRFHSGMVGGHCIPVDPYYLAEWYGDEDSLPLRSRETNERFVSYVIELAQNVKVHGPRRILVLGLTYKPDVADIRNSGGGAVHDGLLLENTDYIVHGFDPLTAFDSREPGTRYNVVVGCTNHAIFHDSRLIENLPLAIDCTFINVGQFTSAQLSNIYNVINL